MINLSGQKKKEKPQPTDDLSSVQRPQSNVAGDIGQAIGKTVRGAAKAATVVPRHLFPAVGSYLSGFKEGVLPSAQPGEAGKDDLSGVKPGEAPAVPQETQANRPSPPVKDVAGQHITRNSKAADQDLNANNRQAIDGLEGIEYAGRYGDTDVLARVTEDEQGNRHGQFSDFANIDTLSGGPAAPLPAAATPGNTISNGDLAGISAGTPGGAGISFAGGSVTPPELIAARQAAMERGDFSAVERSYMSSGERAEADAKTESDNLRLAAAKQDPLGALKVENDTELAKYSAQQEHQSDLSEIANKNTKARAKIYDDSYNWIMRHYSGMKDDLMTADVDESPPGTSNVASVLKSLIAGDPYIDGPTLKEKAMAIIENSTPRVEHPVKVPGANAKEQDMLNAASSIY